MTTISKERRDAIRAAAAQATPGPWNDAGTSINDFGREFDASLSFEWMPNGIGEVGLNENYNADAAHIANCDPQTILALLDALDAAEAREVAVKPLGFRHYIRRHMPGHEDSGGDVTIPFSNDTEMEATLTARADAAEARLAKAVEALTPSGETKAAFIGEFSFTVDFTNEDGEDDYMRVDVPWTTLKEIMAAIRARAALSELEAGK